MTVFIDISAALDKHLNDMSGVPAVAWENVDYVPTVGTLYLRPTNITAPATQATLGDAGTDRNEGIYQVDVFAPTDEGKNEAITMADTIADRFKRGTLIVYNGRNVRIVSASIRRSNSINGWNQLPVEIVYRAFTEART